jgi:hypothetical protein
MSIHFRYYNLYILKKLPCHAANQGMRATTKNTNYTKKSSVIASRPKGPQFVTFVLFVVQLFSFHSPCPTATQKQRVTTKYTKSTKKSSVIASRPEGPQFVLFVLFVVQFFFISLPMPHAANQGMRATTKNTNYTKKSSVIASRPDRAAVRVICAIRGSVFFHFTTHAARGKPRHEGNHEKHELHEKKFRYCFAARQGRIS